MTAGEAWLPEQSDPASFCWILEPHLRPSTHPRDGLSSILPTSPVDNMEVTPGGACRSGTPHITLAQKWEKVIIDC